jgi:thioesterase domain-containing protein
MPEYMLPSLFIPLESWPLTPNGKVDRKALPAPAGQANTAARQPYLAPRDPLELQLSRLWETILEVRPVGVKDNFFELGGHSLLAVRLMAQIKKRFGQDVPLAALFQNSTVEHLARILRRQSASLYQSPLVEIQRRGSQPPFFCVHPADGTVLSYLHLARYLGPQQPFYGLQAPVAAPKAETPARVEEIAAGYIRAIQTVQPQGPYLLGGWSLGGVIALEMAQQLQAAGQEVALLVLLDSWPPPYAYTFSGQDALTEAEIDAHLLADFLADLRGRFADHLPPLPGNFSELNQAEQLHYVVEQARLLETVLPEGGLPQLHELLRVFQSNSRAVQNYRPRPYAGKMVLLRAGEESTGDDPSLGWARLTTGSLEIYTVPGNHYTILAEPYVQTLAERLRDCFSRIINGPFFSS